MLNEVLMNLKDMIDVDVNTQRLVKLRKSKLGITAIIRAIRKNDYTEF